MTALCAWIQGVLTRRSGTAEKLSASEPEPLPEPLDAQPYPHEALPRILRDAVRQAQDFVQAPMALVTCSALSVLSLAAQGLANVRRDNQLVSPISLYLLAVADSGERKTTCDAIFSSALRDREAGQRQEMFPEIAKHEAATAVFEAKKAGILYRPFQAALLHRGTARKNVHL